MATELEYEDIVRYKTSTDSKYRPGLSDNDKRNIREKAARYVLHHQLLHVRCGGGQRSRHREEASGDRQGRGEEDHLNDVPQWH